MVQRSGGLISPTTDGGKSMQKTGNRDSSLISVCLWQNKIGGFWMQGSKKKSRDFPKRKGRPGVPRIGFAAPKLNRDQDKSMDEWQTRASDLLKQKIKTNLEFGIAPQTPGTIPHQ